MLKWLKKFVLENKFLAVISNIFYGLGPLTIALIPIKDIKEFIGLSDKYFISVLVIAAILTVPSIILTAYKSAKFSAILKENNKLKEDISFFKENYKTILNGFLTPFALNSLMFGSKKTNSERITLYIHYSLKNECTNKPVFVPVARYSANPNFNKPGRPQYPDNQGCIAQTWEHGTSFDDQFPDFQKTPSEYTNYNQKNYFIPQNITHKFHMKPRLIYGQRIEHSIAGPIGVIIIESTEKNRFAKRYLDDKVNLAMKEQLSILVYNLRSSLPDLNEAIKDGI